MPVAALSGEDPRQVGPYVIEGRLGGGGMGTVYLGRSRTGRPVAVKLIHPDLADDAEFRTRFRREVAAARRVGGFWAAQVVDADPEAGRPWLAAAYVAGPSLHEAVSEDGALPASVVRTLGATLAEGLAAIHAQDLVHRDLKPSNILLADDGPRVVDFGIVLEQDATSLTRSGAIGTAPYMSPEQVRGRDITAASDVFSLGSVLVFACTGRSPFGAGAAEVVARRVVEDEPELQGVPAGLLGLVESCLAKDPLDRPAPHEVVDRLASTAGAGWELPAAVVAMIADRSAEVGGAEAAEVAVSRHDPDGTERVAGPGTRRAPDGAVRPGAAARVADAGHRSGPADRSGSRAWWRSPAALWIGIGVGVAAGTAAAVIATGILAPEEDPGTAAASPTVGNMAMEVPDESHEVTLEVSATGKDADTTAVGMRYDGRLGPTGLGDSFRSAEDMFETDPDKMYTEIELPWSRTITARGTADGSNISLSAEAGWRDRTAMLTGGADIAVSCRILIDGEVVVEEAGQVNVGCMLLPERLQEQVDEAMKGHEEQQDEIDKAYDKLVQEREKLVQERLDPDSDLSNASVEEYLERLQELTENYDESVGSS